MFVKDRMSSPAITATPDTEATDALRMMYVHKIRRLPIVDDQGRLVGIVTQRDLLAVSPGTTPLGKVMTASPYTVAPETPIVHAAGVLRNLGIGALPVVDSSRVVGIITESDIFDAFLELLGTRHAGVRVIVPVIDISRDVGRILQAVAMGGGRLTGLTTLTAGGRPSVMVTTDDRDPHDLVRALSEAGFEPSNISVESEAA